MITNKSEELKKDWTTPELTVYGKIEDITHKQRLKQFGAGDDMFNEASTV